MREKDGGDVEEEEKMYGGNRAGKVRKGGNNGCVMNKETGRMREREV